MIMMNMISLGLYVYVVFKPEFHEDTLYTLCLKKRQWRSML